MQYLKSSPPHDRFSVQNGAETGARRDYSTVPAVSFDRLETRPPTLHRPSVRDQRPSICMCTCGLATCYCQSVLTGPAGTCPRLSGCVQAVRVCQAATISSMMTTIIAQSSWPELCGIRKLRTRCAAATCNPALARFLRLLAKKRSRHRISLATGGFPSGLSGLPSVRGVTQHAGHCNPVADRRPAGFPIGSPVSAPRKKPEGCTARAQPPGNEGVPHLCQREPRNLSCESPRYHHPPL
jgi:hypothetical protein